jgi:hypothetical protein
MRYRELDRDKLREIILVPVHPRLQLGTGPVLQKPVQKPVTGEVEQQYSHEQYGSNSLQS